MNLFYLKISKIGADGSASCLAVLNGGASWTTLELFYLPAVLYEAIGFYLAYLLLIIVVSVILGSGYALIVGKTTNFILGVRMGTVVATIVTFVVSFSVLKAKNLIQDFTYLLLALIGIVFALFGGGVFGLIPVAFFTTRSKAKHHKE